MGHLDRVSFRATGPARTSGRSSVRADRQDHPHPGIHQAGVPDGRLVEHRQGPDILAMLLDMGLATPTPDVTRRRRGASHPTTGVGQVPWPASPSTWRRACAAPSRPTLS
jgi:hypothetical protein